MPGTYSLTGYMYVCMYVCSACTWLVAREIVLLCVCPLVLHGSTCTYSNTNTKTGVPVSGACMSVVGLVVVGCTSYRSGFFVLGGVWGVGFPRPIKLINANTATMRRFAEKYGNTHTTFVLHFSASSPCSLLLPP